MTRRRGLTPRWSWSLTIDPRMRRASPNYGFETCPADEYEFVVAPRKGVYYPHTPRDRRLWPAAVAVPGGWRGEHGRDPIPLASFTAKREARAAGLGTGEVTAMRLYTGPMYSLYNAVLRRQPASVHAALDGNRCVPRRSHWQLLKGGGWVSVRLERKGGRANERKVECDKGEAK